MDILLDLLLMGLAFWAGWHLRAAIILANLASKPEKMIAILEEIRRINQEQADSRHTEPEQLSGDELRIERVGDQLYAYTKQTDEFIAQGPNLETLLELAHQRFPNRSFFGTIEGDSPAKELATKK